MNQDNIIIKSTEKQGDTAVFTAVKVDDQYLLNLVNSGSVRSENYYRFQNEEKDNILVHQKKLSEETGLSIAVGNMEETAEAAMQNLESSISRWNGQGGGIVLGLFGES